MNILPTPRDMMVAESEVTLLATVITQADLIDELVLSYEDFSDADYGLIFRTAVHLHEKGKTVAAVSILEKLANRVDREKLLAACNIADSQPWAVVELARVIRESATRRRMMRVGQKLVEISQSAERMDDDAMAEAEKAFAEIGTTLQSEGPVLIADFMGEYMDELEYRYNHKGDLTGVDTGFKELNSYFGGWRQTDLCIVAARPSMGKTAFALQTALTGSMNDVVVVFSIEMGRFSLTDRLMSSESNVPLYSIRNGRMDGEHWPALVRTSAELESRTLYVDDNARVNVAYIRAKLRKIARSLPSGKKMVVFVDYLQLIKAKGRSRAEEVGEVSQELKAIAKELNCCMVALAQLSRGVEQRQDKRPTLSDIRESGQIEQDADVVAFLYRDEYYNPKTECPNVVEVIIGKNRNGPTGTAEIVFLKEFQKFVDLDRRDE